MAGFRCSGAPQIANSYAGGGKAVPVLVNRVQDWQKKKQDQQVECRSTHLGSGEGSTSRSVDRLS